MEFWLVHLLKLGHHHAPELIHAEHAHEHVDTPAQFIDAMRLDTDVIGAEMIADLSEKFIIVLWHVLASEERFHVLDECHCGEVSGAKIVDMSEEVFVKLAFVTRIILGE
jgi:hypothetical protein